MKLWQKENKLNKEVEKFTVGDDYILDKKLIYYDCIASIAHAEMLGKIGILTNDEVEKLTDELKNIIELDKGNNFTIEIEDEDCHTAIENHLTNKLGDIGKKIHTARSRNDQVLTALRLFYKDELKNISTQIGTLISSLKKMAEKYSNILIPGYTHTRKAMPSSIKLWANSITDSMEDNLLLLNSFFELIDQSPLGTGAGYGVTIKIDREFTAKKLGFKRVQKNPIYSQNSRAKFDSSILHLFSQILFDLNKASSDLIFFTMPGLEYFELDKEFVTGSSIMPQKKNPDVLELLRANYHKIISDEFQIKSMSANLISGYHRDVQFSKKTIIDSFEITFDSLSIFNLIIKTIKVNNDKCKTAMTPELFATEEAYKLVEKGIPFRDAYKIIKEKM